MQSIQECPICYYRYDTNNRMPRIITICGHTICTNCIEKTSKINEFTCPFDKKKMVLKRRDLEEFPINYAILSTIETRASEMCQQHQRPLEWICKTDKLRICSKCLTLNQHPSHEIVEHAEYSEEVKSKFENLKSYLNNMEKLEEDSLRLTSASIAEERMKVAQAADQALERLIADLRKHKEKVVQDIYQNMDFYLEQERTRITNAAKNMYNDQKFADLKLTITSALKHYNDNPQIEQMVTIDKVNSQLPDVNNWMFEIQGTEIRGYESLGRGYFEMLSKTIESILDDVKLYNYEDFKDILYIKLENKQILTVQYFNDLSIKNLSELISSKRGIKSPFSLYYEGTQLENCRTLRDYIIKPKSTLELKENSVLRPVPSHPNFLTNPLSFFNTTFNVYNNQPPLPGSLMNILRSFPSTFPTCTNHNTARIQPILLSPPNRISRNPVVIEDDDRESFSLEMLSGADEEGSELELSVSSHDAN